MKGFELVKREDHWGLYNEDGHKIASTLDGCNSKLSIKNCEAIERGYDLDELAEKHYGVHIKQGHTEEDSLQRKIDFILGFVSALEILGDKKFSETELYRAFLINSAGDDFTLNQFFNNTVLPMFEQTEFDVEIVTELAYTVNENSETEMMPEPHIKLDKDGCLILTKNII